MTVDIESMKEAVGYDPDATASTAFHSKWAEHLDDETLELIDLFVADLLKDGKSKKAAASYKSLITRFCVTGEISEGKSGQSMKSAVRSFIRFNERLAGVETDAVEDFEPEDDELLEAAAAEAEA